MSTEVDQFTYSISLHCLLSVMSCNYNSCRIFSILNKNDFKNNYNLVKNWLKSISLEDGRIVLYLQVQYLYHKYGWCRGGDSEYLGRIYQYVYMVGVEGVILNI